MKQKHYPFTAEPLPYDYEALEPHISSDTLHFHHDKHYATYVTNLNNALEKYPELHEKTLEELISNPDDIPADIRTAVRNNGGGVYNHELYFEGMTPKTMEPGEMQHIICEQFDSMDAWNEELKQAAVTQFGSGYGVFVTDEDGSLKIVKAANQDTPLTMNLYPLLLVDVWEHAYYLDVQNRRPDYVDGWFNLINWTYVENRYKNYLKDSK